MMSRQSPKAYSYVRMSTDSQLKGNSRQRQVEMSAAYAVDHGLQLADESQLEDIGVSAFKGANVREGALGQFLRAAEKGLVPEGSFLLVESFDRLSRQELLKSLSLFLNIIQSGITLVTLQDERVYRADNTDLPELMHSLISMSRAHEESRIKSQRVAAAWASKRLQAKPLTKLCPAWLRLSDDRSRYQIIPERAAVVRWIFDQAVAGMGAYAITKQLNQRRISPFGTSKGWQRSYVAKILKNRAVIGEYQPHKILFDGTRQPVGDPTKDYFPRIIDDGLFYRAQHVRSEHRVSGRGRKGKYVSNLFSGLTTCAYCHSKVIMENKGPPPKGGTFLVCEAAKRGLGCVTTGWRYEHFETSFLSFVDEIELPSAIGGSTSDKQAIDDAIQALEGELIAVRQEMESVYQLHRPDITFLVEKLATLEQRKNGIQRQLDEKKLERSDLEATEIELYQSKQEIKSLISRLRNEDDKDLYKLRSQVAARIRGLVQEIRVAPAGTSPIMEALIKHWQTKAKGNAALKANIISGIRESKDRRYFVVSFKDASTLSAWPNRDDPLEIDNWEESEKFDGPIRLPKGSLHVEVMKGPAIKLGDHTGKARRQSRNAPKPSGVPST